MGARGGGGAPDAPSFPFFFWGGSKRGSMRGREAQAFGPPTPLPTQGFLVSVSFCHHCRVPVKIRQKDHTRRF